MMSLIFFRKEKNKISLMGFMSAKKVSKKEHNIDHRKTLPDTL